MRIPRWATYPAIALLLLVAFIALPRARHGDGAAQRSRTRLERMQLEERAAGSEAALVRTVDFLPKDFVRDASVDYRAQLQAAIEAAAGQTLLLPDFPLRVERAPGRPYGLIVRDGMTLAGTADSRLVTRTRGLQLLRAEGVSDLRLQGFSVEGPGGDGARLAHGLVQITGGERVHVIGLRISRADADGLAISQVSGVQVEGLVVDGASKAAIYLTACSDAIVRDNLVRDFGGHLLQFGDIVGVGIQLSSCSDVLCTQNTIQDGLGIGILCNANQGGQAPEANSLTGNHIVDVSNPKNPSISGGIRLANGNSIQQTRTHVSTNVVWNCGAHGIYVENHGDSVVRNNLIQDSARSGILVSTVVGLEVERNVVLECGEGHGAIQTHSAARGVRVEENVFGG